MTPLMSTVSTTHALESSCPIVLREFILPDLKRLLFADIDEYTTPLSEKIVTPEIDSANAGDFRNVILEMPLSNGGHQLKINFLNSFCDYDDVLKVCRSARHLTVKSVSISRQGSSLIDVIHASHASVIKDTACSGAVGDNGRVLYGNSPCTIVFPFDAAADGVYTVTAQVSASRSGNELAKASFSLESTSSPRDSDTSGARAIKQKLVELHEKMLGKSYAVDSAEIQSSYRLFVESWTERTATGQTFSEACNWYSDIGFFDGMDIDFDPYMAGSSGGFPYFDLDINNPAAIAYIWKNSQDPQHTKQAWMTVIAYLMTHYDYIYE